ncbi:MAG: hypothetical protein ABSA57_14230 [Candidatus Acidiferrales bacterium]|jgi:hypothetical protein
MKKCSALSRDRPNLVERLKRLSARVGEQSAEHGQYKGYSAFVIFGHLTLHDVLATQRIKELLLKNDWE